MGNLRANGQRKSKDRDGELFVAMPWVVLDSQAYQDLSYAARSLLTEFARQYKGFNNGALLASERYLSTRGWNSADVISRAKKQLLDAGFIYETVKGHRPSKASWYALTWHSLAKLPGYDYGAEANFVRSAYAKKGAGKKALLTPNAGATKPKTAPPAGASGLAATPPRGTASTSIH